MKRKKRKIIKKSLEKPGFQGIPIILALDEGTTGSTALIVDGNLKVLGSSNVEFRQIFPVPGQVEHNLEEIWAATLKAIRGALSQAKISAKRISAIGITNQRETVGFWNRKTGKPAMNALVWQDRRTTDFCQDLKKRGLEPLIREKTGLVIDPYFSASKIHWALKNNAEVKTLAAENLLACGTIDTYLLFKLTAGKSFFTEVSNASRTMLFNIKNLKWDEELLKVFEVPKGILPEVKESVSDFGATHKVPGLPDGIPIFGILGDQQSALLGQACIDRGMAKCTYGTGSFILMNTGDRPVASDHGQLTTIAWTIHGKTQYALEGGAFTAGAAVQWVRDGLEWIKKSQDIEAMAKKVKSTDGVVFVPGFVGLGAPHWAPSARATFFGITRGTKQAHMARAVLEGIALMNHDILKAMEKDLGGPLQGLNVDGGASQNDLLIQFQADVLGCKLTRPKMVETTALGAIFAAGLGLKIWKELHEIKKSWKKEKDFLPKMGEKELKEKVQLWNDVIQATKQVRY